MSDICEVFLRHFPQVDSVILRISFPSHKGLRSGRIRIRVKLTNPMWKGGEKGMKVSSGE